MDSNRALPLVLVFTIITLTIVSQGDCVSVARLKRHAIHKRTILQLCGLITLHTGRSCLDYSNYGCFCGLGNRGHSPRDAADQCCKDHDDCYGEVSCSWFYPQWVGYNIDCNGPNNCTCTDSAEFNPCARSTCECDIKVAKCLLNATYNYFNQNYNRQLC